MSEHNIYLFVVFDCNLLKFNSWYVKYVQVFGAGSNMIGILPGKNWQTPKDRPIIIGAHWDTVPNTPGRCIFIYLFINKISLDRVYVEFGIFIN